MTQINQRFKFWGEHKLIIYSAIIGFLIIEVTLILLLFISNDYTGMIISFVLLTLLAIWMRKMIIKVGFTDEYIIVNLLYRRNVKIQYENIKKIYKHKEGFLPFYIYVCKLNSSVGLKKITFYCSEKEFLELKVFLTQRDK